MTEKREGRRTVFYRMYLRRAAAAVAVFMLFCAVFLLSFYLYHLPVEAALYPILVCAVTGAAFLAVDLIRTKRRHDDLCRIAAHIDQISLQLPEAADIAQADYQAIVCALRSELADREETASRRYREMVEYYTLWAHQIKTPISAMRLTLQSEDSAQNRRLSAELIRIEQYVEMVMAFLRLEGEGRDLVLRTCRLDGIVRQSVKRFAPSFIDRRLRLNYTPMETEIVTDEKWLSFVIEQVLSNALKYTRTGGVSIYMKDEKTLCIEDTGIGIAPEDLPRIFERGYTGYNGREQRQASGIGLYLSRRVCRDLGADISASSQVGKGTVISIRFDQYDRLKE